MSALNSLISGADCGPSNALSSVVKHAEADRSLQRDRVGGPSQAKLHHLPSTGGHGPSEADQAFARQFFDNNAGAIPSSSVSAAPFSAMNLPYIHGGIPRGLPAVQPSAGLEEFWAMRAARGELASPLITEGMSAGPSGIQWSAEFSKASPGLSGDLIPQTGSQLSAAQNFNPMMAQPYAYSAGVASMYAPQMINPQYAALGSAQQPDWESEFSKVTESTGKDKGKGRLVEVDDNGQALDSLEEAFKKISVDEEAPAQGDLEDYMKSFEKVWEEVKAENSGKSLNELSQMEADYRQLLKQSYELDGADPQLLNDMNEQWGLDEGLDSDFGMNDLNMTKFDENGVPLLESYEFELNNPFLRERPGPQLLDAAKGLLASNGSLDEAALLIEASIQDGYLGEGGYEAWLLLGRARSMDEREVQALKALREGTRIAREAGAPDAGLMDLAISYTNESFDLASHYSLRQWLLAKYPTLAPPEQSVEQYKAPWSSHSLTSDAFIAVAQQLHAQGLTDPDLQTGLGVLFYANAEYEKARDCFESALQSRPDDYLMWNRLGSSLSNGSKPEEALGAYREALRLRPTYTRAIYNVGVACLNIGAHKEAAEHFLSALTLRGVDRETPGSSALLEENDKSSDQIWQTLSRTFVTMERPDLVDLAKIGDVQAFRGEFDF